MTFLRAGFYLDHIFEDLKNQEHKTAVIVGKGPTASKFNDFIKEKDPSKFVTFALNDAVKINENFDYFHFVDIEAFNRNIFYLLELMRNQKKIKIIHPSILNRNEEPGRTHRVRERDFYACQETICYALSMDWARDLGITSHVDIEEFTSKKVFGYDRENLKSTYFHRYPAINLKTRSSEAVMDILAKSGFKKIVTFGINGGVEYCEKFKDIPRKKPWEGHDTQFKTINEIKSMYNLQISFL